MKRNKEPGTSAHRRGLKGKGKNVQTTTANQSAHDTTRAQPQTLRTSFKNNKIQWNREEK